MLSAIFFWAGSGKGKIMTHYALIGHPLGHSLSPQIHRALLAAAHLEGDYRLLDIAPEDAEMLQDLVISAVNEALRQADDAMNNSMSSLTGGLNIPGLGL